MANRSHIYTCDEVPGGKGFYARGLSEHNWDIPIVHKLMVGSNPRIVRSAIWEHDVGILGDREGAFDRSIAFFDKLGEGELAERKDFDDELAQMKEFLASAPPSKYVLLEAGEILDLQDGELPELVAALHLEIPVLAARVVRAIAGQEDDWLNELRADWGEKARPGYWSDILYYSFSKDAEEEPAAKAKPATKAKKPAAKAKKPAAKAKKPAAKAKPATKAKKPAAKTKPAAKAKPTAKAKMPAAKKAAAKKSAKPPTKKPAKQKR